MVLGFWGHINSLILSERNYFTLPAFFSQQVPKAKMFRVKNIYLHLNCLFFFSLEVQYMKETFPEKHESVTACVSSLALQCMENIKGVLL